MSVVEDVKSKIDIVEVIGAYVKLTRSGRNYRGLSPFQAERTPSFFVFPETQTFKDFSSGEQGDVFSFLMKKEGLTFNEALRELARRAGIELHERTEQEKVVEAREVRLRHALTQAADYFHHLLTSAPQAAQCRAYLHEKRRLTTETINAWQLGYSLAEYHGLTHFLTARGFDIHELIEAGLVIENEEGRRYDRFRGRLMIPIRDEKGSVVGFGSRALDGSEPKYMNSPQTPVFDKGRLLFGLDRARHAIRSAQAAVLVEGYMDVIGAHQAGFTNVVAGMGTSLTETQLRLLKRLSPRIVLALDPDAAGNRAVLRSLDVVRESFEHDDTPTFDPRGMIRHESKLNTDIRVAVLPDGLDPDELVLDSPERWREVIANARPIIEHVIDTLLNHFDTTEPRGKSEAVKVIAPIVRDLSDPVRRDTHIQQIARRLQLNPRTVAEAMGLAWAAQRTASRPAVAQPSPDPNTATDSKLRKSSRIDLELHLIALLARRPTLLMDANVALARANLEVLSAEDFVNPALRVGFNQLSRAATGQPQGEYDDEWLSLIADYAWSENAADNDDEAVMREEAIRTALRLRMENLDRERSALAFMIDDARQAADAEKVSQYNLRLVDVLAKHLRAQKALRLRGVLVID
ncbi:MAG: DNA primase [Anaerolineae bacterium]|nr:DNA primase [Thermoflexales bacterium]MDW8408769.1 DNA primase [Anaerolineae bacterium]